MSPRPLSTLGWIVAWLVVGCGLTPRVARAQACMSTDNKLSIGGSAPQGCNQVVNTQVNQTGLTAQWLWTDINEFGTTQFKILSCGVGGVVTSCSLSPTSSMDGSGTLTLTYNTAAQGGEGTVTINMNDTAGHDFVRATLTVNTPFTLSTAFTNATDQSLARCALGCFAARVSVSTPPYYSLDHARNVTLVYDGDRVRARPFIYADVASAGSPLPNNYQLQVTTSSGAKLHFTNGDSVLTFAGASSGRLAGQLALDSTIATGPLAVAVTVIANYPSGPQSQSTPFKLAAVNERNSPIAHGWTLAGVQHLYAQSDSAALITEGDGSAEVWWDCLTSGCTAPPVGEYSTFTYPSGSFPASSYTRAYPDSTKVNFNNFGQMIRITDSFGNNDSLAYDSQGRLIAIYDPIRTNNGSGRASISLTYGSTYGLASITSPGPNGSQTNGRTTTFRVNASDSTLTTVIDPDGDSTMFGYDSKKRLIWERDRRGDTTKFGYNDLSFKLTSTTTPPVPVDSGNGMTKVQLQPLTTTLAPWQIVGVPTSSTSPSSPAPLGSVSPQGSITDPANHKTSYTVNRWGEPLVVTDALGDTATVSIADSNPVPQIVTTFIGGQAKYTWKGSQLTSYQPPGGGTTNWAYNSGYNEADSVVVPGQPSQRRFIGVGGRIDSIRYASSPSRVVRYTYDSRGRLTKLSDIRGHVTTYSYEAIFGNRDTTKVPSGARTTITFDGFGRDSVVTQTGVDPKKFYYDLLNRLTGEVDAHWLNPVVTTYDGLFVTRIQDAKGQIYKFDVDALGRPKNAYDLGDTTKFTSYRYSVDGLLAGITNRRGQRIQNTYDALQRQLSSVRLNGSMVMADSFAYDNLGLRTVMWSSAARDSIFVDASGWTDSVVTRVAGVHQRFRVQYVPDSLLRLKSTLIADSTGVQLLPRYLTYDSTSGGVASLALSTGSGLKTTFTFNNQFNQVQSVFPGNIPMTDTLTSSQEPFQRQFVAAAVDTVMNQKFGFDSAGRLSNDITTNLSNHSQWSIAEYNYDPLSRLGKYIAQTSTSLCPADTTYGYQCTTAPTVDSLTYDNAGNLVGGIMGNGVWVSGKYENGNRDTTLRKVSHTFDADGNVLTNGSRTYYWGVEGHLDSVTAGSERLHYGYNAAGLMVTRWRNSVRDRVYLWDGNQLLAEFDSTGAKRTGEYVSRGIDAPFAFVAGPTSLQSVSYFMPDAPGNVVGLIKSDSSGVQSVRERYTYDEFGVPTAVIDSGLSNRLLWKGMFYESDSTRLYFARARWYDPQQGRFMSEDPLGIAGGLNQYTFAASDYINGRDPSGMCDAGTPTDPGNLLSFDDVPCDFGPIVQDTSTATPPDSTNCTQTNICTTPSSNCTQMSTCGDSTTVAPPTTPDYLKEQHCEQQAQAAFGPFLTPESVQTTSLSTYVGVVRGGAKGGLQGLAISMYIRFAVKSLNYTNTLRACRDSNGSGGFANWYSPGP